MTDDLKQQIRQRFEERSKEPGGPRVSMTHSDWLQAWVNVMLDVTAEVLAEKISETKPSDES